jgi:hypothetical protein
VDTLDISAEAVASARVAVLDTFDGLDPSVSQVVQRVTGETLLPPPPSGAPLTGRGFSALRAFPGTLDTASTTHEVSVPPPDEAPNTPSCSAAIR